MNHYIFKNITTSLTQYEYLPLNQRRTELSLSFSSDLLFVFFSLGIVGVCLGDFVSIFSFIFFGLFFGIVLFVAHLVYFDFMSFLFGWVLVGFCCLFVLWVCIFFLTVHIALTSIDKVISMIRRNSLSSSAQSSKD